VAAARGFTPNNDHIDVKTALTATITENIKVQQRSAEPLTTHAWIGAALFAVSGRSGGLEWEKPGVTPTFTGLPGGVNSSL